MARQVSDKTKTEYEGVLRNGVTRDADTDALTLSSAVGEWSHSRKIVLGAALTWALKQKHYTQAEYEALRDLIPFAARAPRVIAATMSEAEAAEYETQALWFMSPRKEIALIPLYMGLRASEVLSLTHNAVSRAAKGGMLHFLRKGNKETELPCGKRAELFTSLARFKFSVLGDLLHTSTNHSTRLHELDALVKEVGHAAGFETHTHALRHAFAQRMLRNGANVRDIQEWLDHDSLDTTQRYLRADVQGSERFT